jgi:hypothetical protein
MTKRRERFKRSAGTVFSPVDVLRVGVASRRQPAMAADAAAIDRGEGRTMPCWFRGLYGDYPRRFRGYFLDLAPDRPVLREFWVPFVVRRRIPITEDLISARVRPFESTREARRFVSTGLYAPEGPLQWAGNAIVSYQTPQGVLEFGVKRADVPLLLHYADLMRQRRDTSPPE